MVALAEAQSESSMVLPAGRPAVLAVVRAPANGVTGAANRCVAVVLGADKTVFTLFDARGRAVGAPAEVPVQEGRAAYDFKNPAVATGYRLVIEAPGVAGLLPVRTGAFNVTAATPAPAPQPPAPVQPAKPTLAIDAAAMASAKPGQPCRLRVTSTGLTEFGWVVFQDDAAFTWRGQPQQVKTNGEAFIDVTFLANRDRVKVFAPDLSVAVDSPFFVAPDPVIVPAVTSGDSEAAGQFAARLVAGVNVERGRAWSMSYQGQALNKSDAYYRYLAGLGLTHVRFFFPVRPNADMLGWGLTNGKMPSAQQIDTLLDACSQAVKGGLRVLCDWADVVTPGELRDHWPAWQRHFDLVGQRIAARPDLSPEVMAVGTFNELEASGNPEVNQFRLDGHAALRARLPQHVLVTGGAYWDDWRHLTDDQWAAPADKRAIAQWHHYEDAEVGQPFWRDVAAKLQAFKERHGLPTICAEAGPDRGWDGVMTNFSPRWLRSMQDQAAVLKGQGLTWWAITDGAAFRLSRGGSDATFRPEIEPVVKSTSASLRAAAGL